MNITAGTLTVIPSGYREIIDAPSGVAMLIVTWVVATDVAKVNAYYDLRSVLWRYRRKYMICGDRVVWLTGRGTVTDGDRV